MTIRNISLISVLLLSIGLRAQNFKSVLKIDGLMKLIKIEDTTYVVNFWATWCKPCVEELPAFDSLYSELSGKPVKLMLVSLDFSEDLDKKVKPFLTKRQLKAPCYLLDESNGNDFINKISPSWSGAIPATLFKRGSRTLLKEQKLKLKELKETIASFNN